VLRLYISHHLIVFDGKLMSSDIHDLGSESDGFTRGVARLSKQEDGRNERVVKVE
jgi:hypothetical protein